MSSSPRRARRYAAALALPLAITLNALPALADPSPDPVPPDRASSTAQNGVALMRIVVADQSGVDKLLAMGVDLAEYSKPVDGGIEVHAVLSPEEARSLRDQGFDVRDAISDQSDYAANLAERRQALAAASADAAETDTLTPLRAEWFTSLDNQRFLSVEVKTSATDAQTVLTATWDSGPGTAPDSGGSTTMSRFTDAGQYMYHRFNSPLPITETPTQVTITSSRGGSVTVPVTKWLGEPRKAPGKHYVQDFVDHYMDPTEVTGRIVALSKQFPNISEIIDLPYKTNGYRRQAQAQFGTGSGNALASTFYVTSKAYGSEGGNDVSVALASPGTASAPLSVAVNGKDVVVSLATDASGAVTSTASEVVAALNGDSAASALLTAALYRTSPGTGVVAAAPATKLTDNLKAPATVSRQPFQMKALRIGKSRDGSKTGVFLYCQEHAREWVTPLTCVETAERLLRNYALDADTKKLVNNLDIFIVPTINPDGAHYSMYDYNMQRKNMVNYCAADGSDPARRNSWGVDLNRNFSVGSASDGYVGGSTTCTGETYSGPSELSEPETRNEVWLTEQYPNIKFAMNTHSYGGYFMWPPGAYKSAGRETLPRPDLGTEEYFWNASAHILSAVQGWRGTAIWPGRTGPVIDVLYSAAGNSADEFWYNKGIIGWDFEVGADVYDPATNRYTSVGFQPPFDEGHEEAMEFSNGQIGILEVAQSYEKDKQKPESKLVVSDRTDSSATFTFTVDEPANVYYTLDGSRPTLSSPKLTSSGMREGAAKITVDKTTEVHWFAMDLAGNVEKNYKPDGNGKNYNKETVTVGKAPVVPLTVTASSRCTGTSAYVAVTAVNAGDGPATVELTTPYGSKTVAGVAPGKQAYQSFNTRAGNIGAGTVTVKATATIDGKQVTSSYDAAYSAADCH
ncbi:M14 family metallopeptidase [Microbispora hainanensis]|uniref:Zinc carboxypeptidase n=1 Tax=Microbispora hainanensis TaxID=568844 RepID=A0A544YPF9_9ACTN|nr:M14 family metallopeptidase [Microbispora hainanensis]TQS18668.1 zinc carboxypeptidase [Microbispora hainanensis]